MYSWKLIQYPYASLSQAKAIWVPDRASLRAPDNQNMWKHNDSCFLWCSCPYEEKRISEAATLLTLLIEKMKYCNYMVCPCSFSPVRVNRISPFMPLLSLILITFTFCECTWTSFVFVQKCGSPNAVLSALSMMKDKMFSRSTEARFCVFKYSLCLQLTYIRRYWFENWSTVDLSSSTNCRKSIQSSCPVLLNESGHCFEFLMSGPSLPHTFG